MSATDQKLTALLRETRLTPGLPPRFQQNVWRRIEDAEAPGIATSWIDRLAALVLRPRFAFATVAVLLFTGVLAGTLEGRQQAKHEAQMNYLSSVAPHSVR